MKIAQNFIIIILLLSCLSSCKSSKRISDNSNETEQVISEKSPTNSLANLIIENAQSYNGVRYKYGGTTTKGIDCSGLVYVSFKAENVLLPRISLDMAKQGKLIKLNEVVKGDLLFFKTNKSRNVINHVGLVVNSTQGKINFIHSTTSKGVITSSLSETYWKSSFIEARRIL